MVSRRALLAVPTPPAATPVTIAAVARPTILTTATTRT